MPSRFRTLLTLGRISNLPTVWSNCLAAWILAGGGGWRLGLLLASGSCLYLGGMFLNDACDVEFDRRHRQERPIPSGEISLSIVWCWTAGLLLAGVLLAIPLGGRALVCALALLAAVVAYDFWHKRQPFAIGLVALCRFLLYLLASFAAAGTVSWRLLAAALGLAAYVLGISLLARHESGVSRPPKWPMALLLIPALSAWLHASDSALGAIMFACLLFAGWLGISLPLLWGPGQQTGRVVSRLLAGMVLVDWLQVSAAAPSWTAAALFAVLFGTAVGLQKRFQAT
jgi:4-hydroxybenzoate polyprenyltransferase